MPPPPSPQSRRDPYQRQGVTGLRRHVSQTLHKCCNALHARPSCPISGWQQAQLPLAIPPCLICLLCNCLPTRTAAKVPKTGQHHIRGQDVRALRNQRLYGLCAPAYSTLACAAMRGRTRMTFSIAVLSQCFSSVPAKQQRSLHKGRLTATAIVLSVCRRRHMSQAPVTGPLAGAGEHLNACWWAWQRDVFRRWLAHRCCLEW